MIPFANKQTRSKLRTNMRLLNACQIFKVEHLKGSTNDNIKRSHPDERKTKEKKKWTIIEILKLMKERQQITPRNGAE